MKPPVSALTSLKSGKSVTSQVKTGEAEQIVTTPLADFATAIDRVLVSQGVPAPAAAQFAWKRRAAAAWRGDRRTPG